MQSKIYKKYFAQGVEDQMNGRSFMFLHCAVDFESEEYSGYEDGYNSCECEDSETADEVYQSAGGW